MATPFVQGHLRPEALPITIETECGHCQQPMRLTLDRDLTVLDQAPGAAPLIFMPDVDWETFTEPNIIDAY